MNVERIKAALDEHDYEPVDSFDWRCTCGWVANEHRDYEPNAHRAHVAEVIAALMPEASESIQWGVRYEGLNEVDVWCCRECAEMSGLRKDGDRLASRVHVVTDWQVAE